MNVSVKMNLEIKNNITISQFEEWFKYTVIGIGGISNDNPLIDKSMYEIGIVDYKFINESEVKR